MAEKNIIYEIENYFLQTKELFGETTGLTKDTVHVGYVERPIVTDELI